MNLNHRVIAEILAGFILASFTLLGAGKDAGAVATASTGWYSSEGCYVFGDTFDDSGDIQSFTTAVAFDYSPCNWVYISGQYYAYPTWYGPVGPGWSYEPGDGEYTYIGPGGTIGDFTHSSCDAGGPCSSHVDKVSNWP